MLFHRRYVFLIGRLPPISCDLEDGDVILDLWREKFWREAGWRGADRSLSNGRAERRPTSLDLTPLGVVIVEEDDLVSPRWRRRSRRLRSATGR